MKKYLAFFLMMTMTLAFLSCDKDDNDDPPPQDDPPPAVHELVGTWRFTHPTEGWWDQFQFNMNLTGTYRESTADGVVFSEAFNYSVSGKVLTIVFDAGDSLAITYEIISPTELLLNFGGGLALIYIRQ